MATQLRAAAQEHLQQPSNHNGPWGGRFAWHKSAPRAVRRAKAWDDSTQGWEAWREHLAQRDDSRSLPALLGVTRTPLLWCPPQVVHTGPSSKLIESLARLERGQSVSRPQLRQWVRDYLDSVEPAFDPSAALEALAWCHALPALCNQLPADVWWALACCLEDLAERASAACSIEDNPLGQQLLAGELPLALAFVVPEIENCRRLARAGRTAIGLGLDELLDGEGVPRAACLEHFRPLLACWTRSLAMAPRLNWGRVKDNAEAHFASAVREAIRMCRADGKQPLVAGTSGAWCPELFSAALALADDARLKRLAAIATPLGKSNGRASRPVRSPAPADNSEWAGLSVLRPTWRASDGLLMVDSSRDVVRHELSVGRRALWSGAWTLEVTRDGHWLVPTRPWEVSCWESDEDVDYLELQSELDQDTLVERHIVYARQDRFVLLADAIHSREAAEWNYLSRLPLADDLACQASDAARELYLAGKKRRAAVLPLGLPEWRRDARFGELSMTQTGLELRQRAQGRGLFAPLFIDLDRRRLSQALTWRQLTVGEDRQPVPPDCAVGYRVQVGRRQWLLYRSLDACGSRTVLGANLVSEFFLARFDPDGTASTMIEID